MPLIDLDTAASQIQQACEDKQFNRQGPFFFLVGAGISYPPIVLASEIEEECKSIAKKYSRLDEPARKSPLDTYSHWFSRAFPQAIQRQRYLRKLIEGKTISQANLRLAHLLLEKTITNLVVTPNFDDFASRALTLFGRPHIVCDHPRTVERIDVEQDDIQIVHVHGSYWFYDCCNLRGEIEQRAQPSVQTTLTMASLLDNILSHRAPLVIGYGGWEGDVIMTALQRRLESRLPYNLYWFCYRQAQVKLMADWLKTHPDVYFVIPPQQAPSRETVAVATEGENRAQDQTPMPLDAEARGFSEKERKEATLSAQQVLDKLIQTFALKAPELTTSPLEFFAKHLRSSLPQDAAAKAEGDIYFIRSVIEHIERANKKARETIQIVETQLERVRDALRRSQYREAIKEGSRVRKIDLTPTELRELMDAMLSAALRLYDNSKEELEGYDLVIAIGGELSAQNIGGPVLHEHVAQALFNKGYTLGALKRSEEAIVVYDEVVKRFGEATEPALREQVGKALEALGGQKK